MTTNAEHYFAPRPAVSVPQPQVDLIAEDYSGVVVAALTGLVMGLALVAIVLGIALS